MSLKETIRKESNKKTIQNRTKRVNNKNKRYNKSASKSDKAYIQGDLRKTSSMRAYGVKESLKKGEKVYGYDDDDIFTGGRKASNYKALKNGEKDVYKVKYVRTSETRKNPTLVTPKDGSKPFYSKSRMLTNKEQDNYEKYGTLKKPESKLEKQVKETGKKIGNTVLNALDVVGTPGYLITGATKGIIDGFNGNGKLDKGELSNAIKGATKNIKTSWDNKANYKGEGKFGFGDIFDSVDSLEERKKLNDPNYESKKIYRASTGNGFDRDKLSDKTKKTLNTIGGIGLDMAVPMEITAPLGTFIKGTGKSFTNVAKHFDANDIGKVVDTILDGQKVDDIAKEVMTHKATNKVNKLAGNVDTNQMEGLKLLGKELLSGEQVAKLGDATGVSRAYNQVRNFVQQGQRNKNVEDVVADVINKQTKGRYKLLDPLTKTSMKMNKEQYDLAMGFRPDFRIRQEAKELDNRYKDKIYERELSDYEKITREIQSWIKETENKEKQMSVSSKNIKPNNEFAFNDTPVSPTKTIEEQVQGLLGHIDEDELNTINNSDMSQLDNIPFSAFEAKRKPRNRRLGNAPEEVLFTYLDNLKYSYDADKLDEAIKKGRNNINRSYLDNNGLNEHFGGKSTHNDKYGSIEEIKKLNNSYNEYNKLREMAMDFNMDVGDAFKSPSKAKNPVEKLGNKMRVTRTKQKNKVKLDLQGRKDSFGKIYDNLDPNNITEKQQELLKRASTANDSLPIDERQTLIDEMNDAFFGGESVISDNIKPSKLGKIGSFLDELNSKPYVKYNDKYLETLKRDLTDPIIDTKYTMLGEKYQYKSFKKEVDNKISELKNITKEMKERGRVHAWSKQELEEYQNLTKQMLQLEKKKNARNTELNQLLNMSEGEFYKAYPDYAPRYAQNAYKDESVLQSFDDIKDEFVATNDDLKMINKDFLTDEYYKEARKEAILELREESARFKTRKELDNAVQKRAMEIAEEMADLNNYKLVNANKVEEAYTKKINREAIDEDVRSKQIKELKQNVKNYRKKLDLKYIDTKNSNVNKYNVKTAKENIAKIIKSKWDETLDERALSELYGQQIRILDELGVDRNSYMPKLKEYEKQMEIYNSQKREYIKSKKYKSQNTNPINELETKMKIKKEQRNNILEKILNQDGFTLNKKQLNNEKQRYLNKDEIDFDKYFVAQSGDNIGKIENDFINSSDKDLAQATNDNAINIFDEIRQMLPSKNHTLEDIIGDAEFDDTTLPVRSEESQIRDMLGMKGRKEYNPNKPTDEYNRDIMFKDIKSKNTSDIINRNEKRDFDFSPIRNMIQINKDNSVSRLKSPYEQTYRIDSNVLPQTTGMFNGHQIINKNTGNVTDWIPFNATDEQVEKMSKSINFSNSDIKKSNIIKEFNSNPGAFFNDFHKMNGLLSNLNIKKEIGAPIEDKHLDKLMWYVNKYTEDTSVPTGSTLRNPGTMTNRGATDDQHLEALRTNELIDRIKSNENSGLAEDISDIAQERKEKISTYEDLFAPGGTRDNVRKRSLEGMFEEGEMKLRKEAQLDKETKGYDNFVKTQKAMNKSMKEAEFKAKTRSTLDDNHLEALRMNEIFDRVQKNFDSGLAEDISDIAQERKDKISTYEDLFGPGGTLDNMKKRSLESMFEDGEVKLRKEAQIEKEAKGYENFVKTQKAMNNSMKEAELKANTRRTLDDNHLEALRMNEIFDRVQKNFDSGLAEDIANERERRSTILSKYEDLFAPGGTLDNMRRRSLEQMFEDGDIKLRKEAKAKRESQGFENFLKTQKAMNKSMKEAELKANTRRTKIDKEQKKLDAKVLKEKLEIGKKLDEQYIKNDELKQAINNQRISKGEAPIEFDENNPEVVKSYYNFDESDFKKSADKTLKLYDGALKDFKANVTVNNPGWHAGNFVQNKLLNAQDVGLRAFFPRSEEWDVFSGKDGIYTNGNGTEMDYKLMRKYFEEGGIMNNFINKETQSTSDKNPLSKLFHNVIRPSGKNSVWSGFGALQNNPDETLAKIQNVMAHMDDGDDILTAMDKAQKTLFDYDDLNSFEKNVAKRVIPFYAYAKKNTANQLDYLMNDQRMHSEILNAYNNIQEQIPYGEEREIKPGEENYLEGRIQIPGMSKTHKSKRYDYMLNPKLPFNPTDSADGMTNFSPFINPLVDIAKNEDFFGEEIEKPAKYYLDEVINSYTHPIMKAKMNIDRHKEEGKDFKIPPEIMKILLGISGNYY